AFHDSRTRSAEVCGRVEELYAPAHRSQIEAMARRFALSRSEIEAAGHDQQHVRTERFQVRPVHSVRWFAGRAGEQLAAREVHELRYPMPGHVRRIEPLERDDARPGAPRDFGAHRIDAALHLGDQPFGALADSGDDADGPDALEDRREIMRIE